MTRTALLVLTLAGCTDDARDGAPMDAPKLAHTPGRVRTALGAEAATALRNSDPLWATLSKEAAITAEKNALASDDTIAGYPLASARKALAPPAGLEVAVIVLRDESYLFDLRRRCANASWLGLRYQHESTRVELALGAPCDQLIVGWKTNGAVARWGSVLTPDAARAIRALVE